MAGRQRVPCHLGASLGVAPAPRTRALVSGWGGQALDLFVVTGSKIRREGWTLYKSEGPAGAGAARRISPVKKAAEAASGGGAVTRPRCCWVVFSHPGFRCAPGWPRRRPWKRGTSGHTRMCVCSRGPPGRPPGPALRQLVGLPGPAQLAAAERRGARAGAALRDGAGAAAAQSTAGADGQCPGRMMLRSSLTISWQTDPAGQEEVTAPSFKSSPIGSPANGRSDQGAEFQNFIILNDRWPFNSSSHFHPLFNIQHPPYYRVQQPYQLVVSTFEHLQRQ